MTAPMKSDGLSGSMEDLRELAERIQEETDATKMIDLVRQLIAKFDEKTDYLRRCGEANPVVVSQEARESRKT